MQAILRHINFDVVKCVILASPGFVRDQFYEYMFQAAVKSDIKVLLENKPKFMLVHSSSGFKHSLKGNAQCHYKTNSNCRIVRGTSGSSCRQQDFRHKGSWGGEGLREFLHYATMRAGQGVLRKGAR